MQIALATYSLRNRIRDTNFGMKGVVNFMVKSRIKFVEINNIFTNPAELPSLAKMFSDAGIQPIQLTVDGNNFFQKSEKGRKKQFEFMKAWIDAANNCGMKYIRANMGHPLGFLIKSDTVENLEATFRPILEYTEQFGINFVFENHGGKSSNVDFQLKVKEKFPSKHFGYLLDCGNYKPKESVYENIKKLGKSILIVHAKMYNFNEQGLETTLDYPRIIKLLKEIGYDGFYNIEYEGPLPDEEGVLKAKALLEKQ